MKIKGVFLATILSAVLCISGNVLAALSGSGTEANPYLIQSRADFDEFANPANAALYWASGIHTKLMCDINLAGTTYTQALIAPDTDDMPGWGFQGTPFTGVFDGNSFAISNLTITASTQDCIGLFGCVVSGGQICNLSIENFKITGRDFVGGLVGDSRGSITSCYVTGSVGGVSWIGGLVGINSGGTLTGCYATDSVSGTGYSIGGLVGQNDSGSITSCYATGKVSGEHYVGGLVGEDNYRGSLTGCFWDMETSGKSGSAGGKGLTTSQMKSTTIYQNAGWADRGWVINDGLDYPRLAWENTDGVPIPQPQPMPLLGSGTEQDPYQVWTADDFVLLNWRVDILDKHISLMTNLDLLGFVIYPIGDLGTFTGVFNGNDNIISNAAISQSESCYVGLFGGVGSGGQIRNLGVENATIIGYHIVGGLVGCNYNGSIVSCYATGSVSAIGELSHVGGLVGINSGGTLTGCYATDSVSGNSFIGGLVGWNYRSVSNCYATGSVSGTGDCVGGLVGVNSEAGSLTACYATGSATGSSWVGGLAGYNTSNEIYGGMVTACYATGAVTGSSCVGGLVGMNNNWSINSSFWDRQVSNAWDNGVGCGSAYGVTGKTTTEMKTLSTFTSDGWDFSDADGDAADWMILREGEDYPRLAWQIIYSGDIAGLYGVDMTDLMEVVNNWLEQGCPASCEQADIDNSGTVDLADLSILAANWMLGQ